MKEDDINWSAFSNAERLNVATSTPEEITATLDAMEAESDRVQALFLAERGIRASVRQPSRAFDSNDADVIDEVVQYEGHSSWGFVIYRCTYGDDDGWQHFMENLKVELEESCRLHNAADFFAKHLWTVFDDKTQFDGASTHDTRQHFRAWRQHAQREEQGTDFTHFQYAPRYAFFLHADSQAVQDLLAIDRPVDLLDSGAVNLVSADFGQAATAVQTPQDGSYEPIEGCTDYHVGFLRMPCQLYLPMYRMCMSPEQWRAAYTRPPAIYQEQTSLIPGCSQI